MKRLILLSASALLTIGLEAQNTPASQMERLDRGVVALPAAAGNGNFISWRLLGTDDEATTSFDILRNGTVIARDVYKTNYRDATGPRGASYAIVTKVKGEPVETSPTVQAWTDLYKTLKLDRPDTGEQGGTYSPNDMSVGDVDGDGQYELFVKWDPSNAKDNSQNGITDNVYIDCYRLDGTRLWRIDLGRNIRAGSHYTQFMVYDFDGDGQAEMMCKTGPGSLDGQGNYVNSVATDATIKAVSGTALYRSSAGRITGGQEWLTVFKGATGEAVHTIFYNPNRNMTYGGAADGSVNWGVGGKNDTGSYGNRGERYLAAVAYLDGPDANPSGIFSRGYYDYAFVWAVDFDGQQLHQKWFCSHKSGTSYSLTTYNANGNGTTKTYTGCKPTRGSGSGTMYQNGNHNLSIGDVDGDGCDEIVWGSAALNNDGTLLYGTGYGHGDAIHLADHCPDRPGLEVFQIHEGNGYGWDLHDALTGEIIHSATGGSDNGRGLAGQFDANVRGSLFWSANDGSARSAVTGDVVSSNHGSMNFRIYWDGDLQEELFDGGKIDKWNGNGTDRLYLNGTNIYGYNSSSTCNGSKSTPNLQADLFGDWREELILWSTSDNCTLNIFTTNTETNYRMPTLMHDHTYRMGICWQNTAYNQPPHLGYYLPDAMQPRLMNQEKELTGYVDEPMTYSTEYRYVNSVLLMYAYLPDGTRKAFIAPDGFQATNDKTTKTYTLTGTPDQVGDYKFVLRISGMNGETFNDTLIFHVNEIETPTFITGNSMANRTTTEIYDAAGRRLQMDDADRMPRGLHIIRQQTANGIVTRKVIKE